MSWLDDETRILRQEMKSKQTRTSNFGVLLLFALILGIGFMHHKIYAGGWFPNVWRCKTCGYENYEGISGCAVCGRDR